MEHNPNSMLRWWPALQGQGLPLPRTEIVTLPEPVPSEFLLYACAEHGDTEHGEAGKCTPLLASVEAPVRAACERLGYPAFVRTDLMSGKHSWLETCHVPDAEAVGARLFRLVENQALLMWMDREDAVAAFVVRELLDAQAPFTAFDGLPIGREMRHFVENGEVLCAHPYWEDEENISDGSPKGMGGQPFGAWREALRELNTIPPQDDEMLRLHAMRASRALPGAWSVDFMVARRRGSGDGPRWWLIDMAQAGDSWHPAHKGAANGG